MKAIFYKTAFVWAAFLMALATNAQAPPEPTPPKRKEVTNFLEKATKAYQKNDEKEAILNARSAMVYCSKYKTMNLIALVKEREGKRELSNSYLNQAIEAAQEQSADTDTLFFNKAILANRAGQNAVLYEALAQIQMTENFADYWTLKGNTAASLGKKMEAQAAFRTQVEQAPTAKLPAYNLAILLSQDEPAAAAAMFAQAEKNGLRNLECRLGFLATEHTITPQQHLFWLKTNKRALYEYTGKETFLVAIAKGNVALENRNFQEALAIFKEAATLKNTHYVPHYGMALAYLGLGNDDKAKQCFETTLHFYNFYAAHLGLGFLALKAKDYNAAAAAYTKSLATVSENPAAIEGKGIAAFFLGDTETAKAAFEELNGFTDYRVSYLALVCQGTMSYQNQEYSAAIRAFEKAISLNNHDPAALNGASIAHVAQGNFQKSLPYFEQLVLLVPDDTIVITNYATALGRCEKVKQARQVFQKAIELDPLNDEAINGFGMVLYEGHAYESALVYFQKAAAINPTNYKWHVNIGMTYAALARKTTTDSLTKKEELFALAFAEHDIALLLGEMKGVVFLNKGVIHAWKNEFPEALNYFYQLVFDRIDVRNNLGAVFAEEWERHDAPKAKTLFEDAQRLDRERIARHPHGERLEPYKALIKNEKTLKYREKRKKNDENDDEYDIEPEYKNYIYFFYIYDNEPREKEFAATPELALPFAFAAPEHLLSIDAPLMSYPTDEPCTMLDRKKAKKQHVRLKKDQRKKRLYKGQCTKF